MNIRRMNQEETKSFVELVDMGREHYVIKLHAEYLRGNHFHSGPSDNGFICYHPNISVVIRSISHPSSAAISRILFIPGTVRYEDNNQICITKSDILRVRIAIDHINYAIARTGVIKFSKRWTHRMIVCAHPDESQNVGTPAPE